MVHLMADYILDFLVDLMTELALEERKAYGQEPCAGQEAPCAGQEENCAVQEAPCAGQEELLVEQVLSSFALLASHNSRHAALEVAAEK